MPSLINLPEAAHLRDLTFGVFSDFEKFVTADEFTDTSGDSGAAVNNVDAVGGVVELTSIAIDNNEVYLHSTKEMFLFAANKPLLAVCRLQYEEANTDDANVLFGLMDAVAANHIQDNGAGPVASYSGAVFFKVDGGTNWQVEASIAGTQTTAELTAVNSLDKSAKTAGGASYSTFWIESLPYSSTKHKLNYYIDGVHVYSIDHTYTSATEMELVVGLKLGSANVETVSVDYLGCWQKR